MIAHRLSTVETCDTIFLLEHGRVAAQGDFETLKRTSETFRRMARDPEQQAQTAADTGT